MNKIFGILLIGLLLAAPVFGQALSVTRSIPAITQVNQLVPVTLMINLQNTDPSGLILTENIPANWAIQSVDDSCTINTENHFIKCALYGDSLKRPIQYTLKAPATAPAQGQLIIGEWKTITQSGSIIGGALSIQTPLPSRDQNTVPPAQLTPIAAPDNTLLYVGVGALAIIILVLTWLLINQKKSGPKIEPAKKPVPKK